MFFRPEKKISLTRNKDKQRRYIIDRENKVSNKSKKHSNLVLKNQKPSYAYYSSSSPLSPTFIFSLRNCASYCYLMCKTHLLERTVSTKQSWEYQPWKFEDRLQIFHFGHESSQIQKNMSFLIRKSSPSKDIKTLSKRQNQKKVILCLWNNISHNGTHKTQRPLWLWKVMTLSSVFVDR